MPKYKVGDIVIALMDITESGKLPGDPNAKPLLPLYIHAKKGELGKVVDIDNDGDPTVMFNRTNTATIVLHKEIAMHKDITIHSSNIKIICPNHKFKTILGSNFDAVNTHTGEIWEWCFKCGALKIDNKIFAIGSHQEGGLNAE